MTSFTSSVSLASSILPFFIKKGLPSLTGLFGICEYLGVSPMEFFDEGNSYPTQLADLIRNLRRLDAAELELVTNMVKTIANK